MISLEFVTMTNSNIFQVSSTITFKLILCNIETNYFRNLKASSPSTAIAGVFVEIDAYKGVSDLERAITHSANTFSPQCAHFTSKEPNTNTRIQTLKHFNSKDLQDKC